MTVALFKNDPIALRLGRFRAQLSKTLIRFAEFVRTSAFSVGIGRSQDGGGKNTSVGIGRGDWFIPNI